MTAKINPVIQRLGFSETDKILIIHTDDIGMCQATIDAYADLYSAGTISSGAVMVPCPWFLSPVEYARAYPQTDLGVHLTLTSEWKTYRWRPISTSDPASGMIDREGFFYHWREEAQEYGNPSAVGKELEAQIQAAISAGMQPTHVDTHMYTLIHPKYLETYLNTAYRFGLPAMMVRASTEEFQQMGMDLPDAERAARLVSDLEEEGFPMLDKKVVLKLDSPVERFDQVKAVFSKLEAGITHFMIHPAKDTPELRAIAPDWLCRVADYETFLGENVPKLVKDLGLQVIGYREIQQLMPG